MNPDNIDTYPPQIGDVWRLKSSGKRWRVLQIRNRHPRYFCQEIITRDIPADTSHFGMDNTEYNKASWELEERKRL